MVEGRGLVPIDFDGDMIDFIKNDRKFEAPASTMPISW